MLTSLPAALASLGAHRQFCLYYTLPNPKKPGKYIKIPANYEGHKHDAHDPAVWMTYDEAARWANYHNATGSGTYNVAFVLTVNDPFWFLDIDSRRAADGTNTPLADTLLAAFNGAAVEISGSGTGYHIIGTGIAPDHGKVNVLLGMEFYTEGRFIALTGNMLGGSAAAVASTELLTWLTDHYFPLKSARALGAEWTEEPCEGWNGPTNDTDLIRRALASSSAAAAFQGRASFADLWEANDEVLGRNWPADASSLDTFNHSSADSALATHLAFWTGKDCARILRLMQASALKRDKWEREDYIQDTVMNACATTRNVCNDKPLDVPDVVKEMTLATPGDIAHANSAVVRPPIAGGIVERMPESRLVEGGTFVSPEQQIELFKGCVYIRSLRKVWVPSGELLTQDSFKVTFGGMTFILDHANGKVTTDAWEAFTQSRAVRHTNVAGTCFRPDRVSGAIIEENGSTKINTYMPLTIASKEGDASPFFKHLTKLIPEERDRNILLSYLAACVQYKGVKFKWAPLVQGVEGNGKTFFSMCVAYAVGSRYVHWPKASKLGAQFNSWMHGRLLYCVEDIYTPRNKLEVIEELKPMITGENLEIEGKGLDQETKEVCGNFIFNTNHKDALRKTKNDRRFAHIYCAQQEFEDLKRDGLSAEYMTDLYDWLKGTGSWAHAGTNHGYSIVAHLLATWSIPDEFNPAGNCQRAPVTSNTVEAITHGLGPREQHVMEAIDEEREGFRNGWVSSSQFDDYLRNSAMRITPRERAPLLKGLGYVPHPGLPNGRVQNPVAPEMMRSVLFIKLGHRDYSLEGPAEIARAYTLAQRE